MSNPVNLPSSGMNITPPNIGSLNETNVSQGIPSTPPGGQPKIMQKSIDQRKIVQDQEQDQSPDTVNDANNIGEPEVTSIDKGSFDNENDLNTDNVPLNSNIGEIQKNDEQDEEVINFINGSTQLTKETIEKAKKEAEDGKNHFLKMPLENGFSPGSVESNICTNMGLQFIRIEEFLSGGISDEIKSSAIKFLKEFQDNVVPLAKAATYRYTRKVNHPNIAIKSRFRVFWEKILHFFKFPSFERQAAIDRQAITESVNKCFTDGLEIFGSSNEKINELTQNLRDKIDKEVKEIEIPTRGDAKRIANTILKGEGENDIIEQIQDEVDKLFANKILDKILDISNKPDYQFLTTGDVLPLSGANCEQDYWRLIPIYSQCGSIVANLLGIQSDNLSSSTFSFKKIESTWVKLEKACGSEKFKQAIQLVYKFTEDSGRRQKIQECVDQYYGKYHPEESKSKLNYIWNEEISELYNEWQTISQKYSEDDDGQIQMTEEDEKRMNEIEDEFKEFKKDHIKKEGEICCLDVGMMKIIADEENMEKLALKYFGNLSI